MACVTGIVIWLVAGKQLPKSSRLWVTSRNLLLGILAASTSGRPRDQLRDGVYPTESHPLFGDTFGVGLIHHCLGHVLVGSGATLAKMGKVYLSLPTQTLSGKPSRASAIIVTISAKFQNDR